MVHSFLNEYLSSSPQPVIARFFKEIGRADELGSGVRNLFKYCRHYSGRKIPELIEEDIFKCIVPLTAEATTQATEQATPQVTPQVERLEQIYKFCQTPRSSKEIQAHIKKGFRDESLADLDNLPDPDVLAEEIIENLEAGVESFKQIMESINGQ
jgi:predicted HTH transcriptional regulator